MTTLDPRGLEEAAEAVGRHIHCLRRNCTRCGRQAEAAITAYLAVTQPIVETVEELEGLDYGSVVELRDGTIRLRADWGSGWASAAAGDDYPDDTDLPARVIWRPHESP